LRALLRVIGEQVDVVEDDIRGLYSNWFIETCEDWVVPYIADLIGYEPASALGPLADPSSARGALLNNVLVPRREVGSTLAFRHRKGTLALLELLADAAASWPARAVEFYRLLSVTQSLRHVRLERARTVDLRDGAALGVLDGPFESSAHLVDVRRVSSARSPGRYSIGGVGLFVWRLQAYSLTRTPAYCLDRQPNCYRFSLLGNDTPLFVRPERETDPQQIASELSVPTPIRRRALEVEAADGGRRHASPDYYGEAKSFMLWTYGWPGEEAEELVPFPIERVVVANLSDFGYAPPPGYVAVDPELGRIAFPIAHAPDRPIHVSYQSGFSADLGGGEYQRTLEQHDDAEVFMVSSQAELTARLEPWRRRSGAGSERPAGPRRHVLEITDSGAYRSPFRLEVPAGDSLQIRAANGKRPVLFIPEEYLERLDDLSFTLGSGSELCLDGLLIVNRSVTVRAAEGAAPLDPCRTRVKIRHCTLVPGWALDGNCRPLCPTEPSLTLLNLQGVVEIDRSIIGSIQAEHDEIQNEPLAIEARDSIIDATGSDCDGPDCEAIGRLARGLAHVSLRVERCTVIGRVRVHSIELAEDSLFTGTVTALRTQRGCVRYCYVPPGSRTPRRYQCQPDLAERARRERDDWSVLSEEERGLALRIERQRVSPELSSRRYGTPTYCQLALACALEITRGASDEAELGAFHDLFQAQRATLLGARLDEYTPAAADADLIFAS
ncbi:MAG TPA: hypothetical protein VEQ58_08465, partial [Polyangiaceae bacterium]|nr:hypothetical protein [Polyangiaceae bacterium]